jgi:hypothetical protein
MPCPSTEANSVIRVTGDVLLYLFSTIKRLLPSVTFVTHYLITAEDVDYTQKYISGNQGLAFLHSINCNDAKHTTFQTGFICSSTNGVQRIARNNKATSLRNLT